MSDEHYMRRCVRLAHDALTAGEVPVGAVIVDRARILGEGSESTQQRLDPCAHAEVRAIQAACRATQSSSLSAPCAQHASMA